MVVTPNLLLSSCENSTLLKGTQVQLRTVFENLRAHRNLASDAYCGNSSGSCCACFL